MNYFGEPSMDFSETRGFVGPSGHVYNLTKSTIWSMHKDGRSPESVVINWTDPLLVPRSLGGFMLEWEEEEKKGDKEEKKEKKEKEKYEMEAKKSRIIPRRKGQERKEQDEEKEEVEEELNMLLSSLVVAKPFPSR